MKVAKASWSRLACSLGIFLLPACLVFGLEGRSASGQEPASEPAETAEAADEPSADATANEAADEPAVTAPDELSGRQQQIAARFEHLEQVLLRMAELTAPTDPHRAALLRKAVEQSKKDKIKLTLDSVVMLLDQELLSPAIKDQEKAKKDMGRLLDLLLSENRDKKLASEQARMKEYLKRVKDLIKEEEVIKDQTGRGADTKGLSQRQGKNAAKAGELAKDIKTNEEGTDGEGKDGEGKDGEGKDGEGKDGEGKDGEGKDGEGKDGEGKPGEGKPGEGKPGEGKPGEGKPGEGKPGEGKPGEGKPGEGKPGEGKPGEGKPGEGKPGEGKPGEGKPGEGKPGEGKPGEGKPGEGKPGEGKPGEGKPGEGKPGEGKPGEGEGGQGESEQAEESEGAGSARKRIQAAEQRMKDAQEKLEKARRDEAKEDEQKALDELYKARAELEEILRLLREEQIERMLAMLEARFRKMLEMQLEVYEGTMRLDKLVAAKRGRNNEIEAGRLSRKESAIATEADKALTLLREEGTAVAMPEAVEQMLDDMRQVVVRLAAVKTDFLTQATEEEIIKALEEMIDSLEKAQKQMEAKKGKPMPPGEPQDQPLIDKIAELKMIRALQMRVNTRTQRYSNQIEGEQANDPELIEALDQLAEREQKITKATKDIAAERNQ